MESHSPEWLLWRLEQKGALPNETCRLREFMEELCRDIREFLPPQAEGWLRVAKEYRLGLATADELEQARVSAWKYLGKRSCEIVDPKVAAVRALIGLLFPDDWDYRPSEDPRIGRFDAIDFCLQCANSTIDKRKDQAILMLRLFPELTEAKNP